MCFIVITHIHNCLTALCLGLPWTLVGQYQKKHSPIHTYPDHHCDNSGISEWSTFFIKAVIHPSFTKFISYCVRSCKYMYACTRKANEHIGSRTEGPKYILAALEHITSWWPAAWRSWDGQTVTRLLLYIVHSGRGQHDNKNYKTATRNHQR